MKYDKPKTIMQEYEENPKLDVFNKPLNLLPDVLKFVDEDIKKEFGEDQTRYNPELPILIQLTREIALLSKTLQK